MSVKSVIRIVRKQLKQSLKKPSVLAVLTMKMQTVFQIDLPAIIKEYVDDAALFVGRWLPSVISHCSCCTTGQSCRR